MHRGPRTISAGPEIDVNKENVWHDRAVGATIHSDKFKLLQENTLTSVVWYADVPPNNKKTLHFHCHGDGKQQEICWMVYVSIQLLLFK